MILLGKTLTYCTKSKKVVSAFIIKRKEKVYLRYRCGEKVYMQKYRWEDPRLFLIISKIFKSQRFERKDKLFDRLGVMIAPFCNLSCPFCDIKNDMKNFWIPSYKEIKEIIDKWNLVEITLSGGEVLLRKDIFSLIEKINNDFPEVFVAILTNGILTSKESIVKKLKKLRNVVVVVSFSINKKSSLLMHGKDIVDFQKRSINLLEKHQIPFSVSITVTKYSFGQLVGTVKRLMVEYKNLKNIRIAPIFWSASNPLTKKLSKLSPSSSEIVLEVSKRMGISLKEIFLMQKFNHSVKKIYETIRFGDYKNFRCPLSLFFYRKNHKVYPLTRMLEFQFFYVLTTLFSSKPFLFIFKILRMLGLKKVLHKLLYSKENNILLVSFFSYFNSFNVDLRFLIECNGRNVINRKTIDHPVSFCKYFMVGWR